MNNFSQDILLWYHSNDIMLPWREKRPANPYFVLLSEIMLQQTQVKTVIPYFINFIEEFPTIQHLAKSSQERVLKSWEGLGYYSRARNFYKTSKIIVNKFNGVIPNNYSDLIKLPGIGNYIASAFLSIFFNKKIPAIDGNAKRVVSRLRMIKHTNRKLDVEVKNYLELNISKKSPGDFNQAIMDLGRTICTPKNPLCMKCPIINYCGAHKNNVINKFPAPKLKNKHKPHYFVVIGIIWKNKKILISKRPNNALLGGLWEFPGGKLETNETNQECIIREVKEELNVIIEPLKYIKQIKHSYSHFSITMSGYHCKYVSGTPKGMHPYEWKWIDPHNLTKHPFPKASHFFFNEIISTVQ